MVVFVFPFLHKLGHVLKKKNHTYILVLIIKYLERVWHSLFDINKYLFSFKKNYIFNGSKGHYIKIWLTIANDYSFSLLWRNIDKENGTTND